MKRPVRNENGKYVIGGVTYSELFGSRAQVHNGTAYKTTGGLTKKDLVMNKWGRIVSEKKHKTAKKEKRLQKYGYYTKKGKFGAVKRVGSRKNKSKKGGFASTNVKSTVVSQNNGLQIDTKH
jgi:DVNP family